MKKISQVWKKDKVEIGVEGLDLGDVSSGMELIRSNLQMQKAGFKLVKKVETPKVHKTRGLQ